MNLEYNKKGDIWVSAILYLGLGVILLSIILAVGLPAVNKLKDKNIAIETENLMSDFDTNIRAVYSEGTGSRRPFKFEITKGTLTISNVDDTIIWEFETSTLLSEPGVTVQKGNLLLYTKQGTANGVYVSDFILNYSGTLNLMLDNGNGQLTGANNLLITNIGANGTSTLPVIRITPL